MKTCGITLDHKRKMNSKIFWSSVILKNFLTLIFQRLDGKGCVDMGENGQKSEVVQLWVAVGLHNMPFSSSLSRAPVLSHT